MPESSPDLCWPTSGLTWWMWRSIATVDANATRRQILFSRSVRLPSERSLFLIPSLQLISFFRLVFEEFATQFVFFFWLLFFCFDVGQMMAASFARFFPMSWMSFIVSDSFSVESVWWCTSSIDGIKPCDGILELLEVLPWAQPSVRRHQRRRSTEILPKDQEISALIANSKQKLG